MLVDFLEKNQVGQTKAPRVCKDVPFLFAEPHIQLSNLTCFSMADEACVYDAPYTSNLTKLLPPH